MPRSTTNNTTPGNLSKLAHRKQTMLHYDGAKMERLLRSRAGSASVDEDWAETEAACPHCSPSFGQTGSQLLLTGHFTH